MWIRSQDKELLVNVNDFSIEQQYEHRELSGYSIDSSDYELGTYSTKENAMNVLDMIQRHLMGFPVNNCTQLVKDCRGAGIEFNCVFEMPQDWR